MAAYYRLRLSAPAAIPSKDVASTLLWTSGPRSTFETALGPSLGRLGPVPKPNIEFVRLAVAVMAADRSTPRRGRGFNWSRREVSLSVPVFEPDRWRAISDRLTHLVNFLTGDSWEFEFVGARAPKDPTAKAHAPSIRAVLVSGGADSAVGALMSRSSIGKDAHVLVSHLGATNLSPVQQQVARRVGTLLPNGSQRHVQVTLTRRQRRLDGSNFPDEFSTRSRSLLFLSLGLAVASMDAAPLWVPENGFASLNPPLSADQRGSLSTRTTHPALLAGLSALLAEVGVHAELSNPFERMTKGEMYRATAELVGRDPASEFLSATHSCAHTGHRSYGFSIRVHCGVCFGCLVRRSAFLASELKDRTEYLDPASHFRLPKYLADKSMERPVQEFIDRGVGAADVSALSLPPTYPMKDALALCNRTIEELRLLWQ